MFVSPHYKGLPAPSLETYLELSIALFNAFPPAMFDIKIKAPHASKVPGATESDGVYDSYNNDDEISTRVFVVDSFDTTLPPLPLFVPKIDGKTRTRMSNIVSVAHLTSLIGATQSKPTLFPGLVAYLFALTMTWSTSTAQILNIVLANAGGALVREIYRNLVRRSPLGQEENSGNVMDVANASYYPPVLFLTDLYSQALLTMGDDEFFGSARGGASAAGSRAARNPLTLDELVEFSKQLLNIAFTLYWRDDGGSLGERHISRNVRVSWDGVRERVTRCLLGIHARECVISLHYSV